MSERQIAILDISGIQEYILNAGSGKLKLIRGASQILNHVNREAWPRLAPEEDIISKVGGNLMATFPDRPTAVTFCADARRRLDRATGGIGMKSAIAPYPDPSRFQECRNQLLENLALTKAVGGQPKWQGGGPFWEQCSVCGAIPARFIIDEAEGEGEPYCLPCKKRNDANDRTHVPQASPPPADFDAIGAKATPEGYLALVYIDFDSMGEYFNTASSTEQNFRALSEHLETTVHNAVRAAMPGVASFEILLVGGDDLAIMLPAQYWLPFITHFASHFQSEYQKAPDGCHSLPPTPTFSAGVVFAHTHFPIGEYFRIGKSLLKSAKRVKGKNSLDWEIVSSSMLDDPIDARNDTANRGESRYRTAKPYSLAAAERLANHVRKLRHEGPSNKVNALYRIAYEGHNQAELDYLHLLQRLDEKSRIEVQAAVGQHLWQDLPNGVTVTHAADFAELWAFV